MYIIHTFTLTLTPPPHSHPLPESLSPNSIYCPYTHLSISVTEIHSNSKMELR